MAAATSAVSKSLAMRRVVFKKNTTHVMMYLPEIKNLDILTKTEFEDQEFLIKNYLSQIHCIGQKFATPYVM